MKKSFLALMLFFTVSTMYAADMDHEGILSGKVITDDTRGFFMLSDGSCWKVLSFITRWRGPLEWLRGMEIAIPDNYKCVPNDWFLGASIQAYPKQGNVNIDESNASNQEELKQCTHLLVNEKTGHILYAISLHPADCMVQVYNEGVRQGYEKGKKEGYDKGYDSGYSFGFSMGESAEKKRRDTP